ncbi:hypothetical protein H311_02381, partial [Anncaliia algerae PRA109]
SFNKEDAAFERYFKELLVSNLYNGHLDFKEYKNEFANPNLLLKLLFKEEDLLKKLKIKVLSLRESKKVISWIEILDDNLKKLNKRLESLSFTLKKLHERIILYKKLQTGFWDETSFDLFREIKKKFNDIEMIHKTFLANLQGLKDFLMNQAKNINAFKNIKNEEIMNIFVESVFEETAQNIQKGLIKFKLKSKKYFNKNKNILFRKSLSHSKIKEFLNILYQFECYSYEIVLFKNALNNETDLGNQKYLFIPEKERNCMFNYFVKEIVSSFFEIQNLLYEENNAGSLLKMILNEIENTHFNIYEYFRKRFKKDIKLSYINTRNRFLKIIQLFYPEKNITSKGIEELVLGNFEESGFSNDELICLSLVSFDISLKSEKLNKGLIYLYKRILKNLNELKIDSNSVKHEQLYPKLTKLMGKVAKVIERTKYDSIHFIYYDRSYPDEVG